MHNRRRTPRTEKGPPQAQPADPLDHAAIGDAVHWTARIRLPGREPYDYPIAAACKRRLERALGDGSFENFFCFDSRDQIVCVRLAAVQYIHLLWDSAVDGAGSENQDDFEERPEGHGALRVHFTADRAVAAFVVDADDPAEIEDGDPDCRPLAAFAMELEVWTPGCGMVSFTDDNGGEDVHLNPARVAIVEVPLAAVGSPRHAGQARVLPGGQPRAET